MDEYAQDNMAVLKRDKKDMLLTNKDPHLSRLYDHSGPHTPNSVSAEGLTQSSMEVEGNYTEESNEHDYQLFEEQGGSYMPMPVLSPELSSLILDHGRSDAYNSGKASSDENNNMRTEILEDQKMHGNNRHIAVSSRNIKPKSYPRFTSNTIKTNEELLRKNESKSTLSIEERRIWNGTVSSSDENNYQQHIRPSTLNTEVASMQKNTNGSEREKLSNPQLTSPPADHYNMQLLAYSAQQQQQLLQQEQKQQQEVYGQGSSSAALQHLAKLRQQQESQQLVTTDAPTKPSASSFQLREDLKPNAFLKPVQGPFLIPGQSNVLTVPLSSSPLAQSLRKSPYPIPNYGGWSVSERGTPDFIRGHVRDLSFGSQDSPVMALQSSDISRSTTKLFLPLNDHKHHVVPPIPGAVNGPEPELKSPLDHPEHQLDRQQRNRFFSSDSGPASTGDQQNLDDEAPLNDRDKEAAATLRELLEQSEKPPSVQHIDGAFVKGTSVSDMQMHASNVVSSSSIIGSSMPMRLLQMRQEIIRNTPPPAYEQSLHPEQALQQFLHSATSHPDASFMQPALLMQDQKSANLINGHVKQEPTSPAVTNEQYFIPNSMHHSNHSLMKTSENQTRFLVLPSSGMEGSMRDAGLVAVDAISQGNTLVNTGLPVQSDPYGPLRSSVSDAKTISVSTTKAATSAARIRRTSSSSSTSSRRKSDGNLTCALCGHSFRSTPALNGHMRVHSTSDKKHSKEERQQRTSVSVGGGGGENAMKTSPVVRSSRTPISYVDVGQSPPNIQPAASVLPGQVAIDSVTQTYIPGSMNQSIQNRTHNGLLTMASAACFLKTEPIRPEYLHPPAVLPQAYVVPHTMLFQQPPMVNVFGSNISEGQATVKHDGGQAIEQQNAGYPLYAAQFQQGLPFSNLNFLPNVPQPAVVPHEAGYISNQQQPQMIPQATMTVVERDNMTVNPQSYVDPQQNIEKPINMNVTDEPFPYNYDHQQLTDANSLSQLASIAVAAANRDHLPDMTSEFPTQFSQSDMQTTHADPSVAQDMGWMGSSVHQTAQDGCMGQQQIYQDQSSLQSETSPIRSGHDPFILPVTVPVQDGQHNRFGEYEPHAMVGNIPVNREPTVTWRDNVGPGQSPLLSSYDDPLMREAVNVANPSKILPNSMMGGTPPTATLFSGARPFRQRHHSEGAHLIKSSNTSILKQILHSPVPTVKLRTNRKTSPDQDMNQCKKSDNTNTTHVNKPSIKQESFIKQPLHNKTMHNKKPEEFWAEPKPVQRRIRRRRHSADCRLLLKSGPLTGTHTNRQLHQSSSPAKKCNTIIRPEAARMRRRPPPLVIPSSVSTFAPLVSGHQNFYQSHLHHRRRPSGESNSSYTGVINDKIPPYTPPPMLSPIRAGSGLYCMTPVTPMSAFHRQKSMEGNLVIPTILEVDETQGDDEELFRSIEPKINIGTRFQASIPELRPKENVFKCKHKASKVWSLTKTTASDGDVFKHLEQFMELSCSAVVPYGGSNKEYALDCLAKSNGDILNAVRTILMRKTDTSTHCVPTKKYTGSGKPWTPQEIKLFDCAMLEHRKDFFIISKMVKSRSTAECIERYYHVVKRHRRRVRLPRRYRDQEMDNFMSILSDAPAHDKKEINLDSVTSPSSSDDDASTKNDRTFTVTGPTPWISHNPSYQVNSPPRNNYPRHASPVGSSQHVVAKPLKTHTARIQHRQIGSPSPAGSPASVVSTDEQPSQIFTCPVCGKSFGKVKSRNAHMKTHGKQAQEKRRQREEEAARRREEMANRRPPLQRVGPIHRTNFVSAPPVGAAQLFQHPQHNVLQQHPHNVIHRFNTNT